MTLAYVQWNTGEETHDARPAAEGLDEELIQSQITRKCRERLNERAEEYSAVGEDPRQDQLDAYLQNWRHRRSEGEFGMYIEQTYRKHMLGGRAVGREYPPWLSIPFLSRGARAACARHSVVSVVFCAAAFEAARDQGVRMGLSVDWLTRYTKHKSAWQQYYEFTSEQAKDFFQLVLYMDAYPHRGHSDKGRAAVHCVPERGVCTRCERAQRTTCKSDEGSKSQIT